ncbi:T9SS type A sorting domain-containing protein [uncultured Psychroserpens sp.]|uniref:T9SS type A sorting domain-containing protein n=1 Tax=uncultured Psychroserpens sp. TaxID=255436 RepID=UPI002604B04E|nr:T9SS type A sorting domain-containing protein [uncultured Psychroserpens sp.]
MKKVIFLFLMFSGLIYGQEFENIGFEDTSCINDCDPANGQMSCVDGWWSDYTQGIVPLKNTNCEPNLVCNGNNSVLLVSTSGSPGSSIRTNNPFFGLTTDTSFTIDLTVNRSSNGASNGVVKVIGRYAGQYNWDVVGQAGPNASDTCEDISIILDPSVTDYEELSFFACTETGTCHGGVGNYIVVDDIRVGKPVVTIEDNCGEVTVAIDPDLNLDIAFFNVIITDDNGDEIAELFNDTGDPLSHDIGATGTYHFEILIAYEVNGQFEFLEYNLSHTITSVTPDPVTITADGTDVTSTLTYEIPCGETCVTINATNITGAVYNTSDPVLTDLNGLFCVPPGSNITSFTAYITGTDSCGDPYNESVLVTLEEDCCVDEPYVEPYWQHPNCPDVVCDSDQWPVHVLSGDGSTITSAGGVVISWDNLDTAVDENILGDWIYVSPLENWQATITYPNGCVYVITYLEECCDDDIFINVLDCPTEAQLAEYEAQVSAEFMARRDSRSADLLAGLRTYIAKRKAGEDCDPCELGFVFIELVDAAGDPISLSMYDSLTWSDGGSGTTRAFDLPMSGEVCFTATKTNDLGYECTYSDCFYYECETKECDGLTAPTNLQAIGSSLTWDPVPGAVEYIISSPSVIRIECCRFGVSIAPITTTSTSYTLPLSLQSKCFVWQVTAVCADGTQSVVSEQACHLPTLVTDGGGVKQRVTIYPNPNKGQMSIEVELEGSSFVELDIYRYDGLLVKTVTKEKTKGADLKFGLDLDLPTGLYLFNFKTKEGVISKRVIIE